MSDDRLEDSDEIEAYEYRTRLGNREKQFRAPSKYLQQKGRREEDSEEEEDKEGDSGEVVRRSSSITSAVRSSFEKSANFKAPRQEVEPKASSAAWSTLRSERDTSEKENGDPYSSSTSSGSSSAAPSWSTARPQRSAPAGPPPMAPPPMAALSWLKNRQNGTQTSSSSASTSSMPRRMEREEFHDDDDDDDDEEVVAEEDDVTREDQTHSKAISGGGGSSSSRLQQQQEEVPTSVFLHGSKKKSSIAGLDDDEDEYEDEDEFGEDSDIIKNPKSSIMLGRRDSSFEEYVADAEARGIVLGRKSGRYDEEEHVTRTAGGGGWGGGGGIGPPFPDTIGYDRISGTKSPSKMKLSAHPFAIVAHESGLKTEHVQCIILRKRDSLSSKLYPEYELISEQTRKPLLLAKKMNMNRTSNYHIFDLTRGQAGSKLSKKSGNYLGKLRARNMNRTEYVLVSQSAQKEELAAITFDRLSILSQLKEGSQPRKLSVIVPGLDAENIPIPNRVESGEASLADMMNLKQREIVSKGHFIMGSKDPVYENGNYRLNFHGRVSMPSVKNFQLVAPDDIENILCQFGKVGEDKFHLDYKAPLNALQAFSFALCQFNL